MMITRHWVPRLLALPLAVLVSVTACGDEDEGPTGPGGFALEKLVTPQGGQADLGGGPEQGGVTVTVPQGAAPQSVNLTFQVMESSGEVSDPNRVGSIYELGPDGQQFSAPVEVRIPWPEGFAGNPRHLLMFTTDASGNPELLSEITRVQGEYLAGKTTHFSPFWASGSGDVATELTLSPGSLTLTSGNTATITPEARNVAGQVITDPAVSYSSSDSDVASVSSAGVITGGEVGSAVITGTSGEASATMSVEVVAGALASITLTPSADTIDVGESTAFSASGADAAGNDLGTLTGLSWSSSVDGIASVNGSGTATGVAPGTATISASLFGATGTAEVVVTPGEVELPPGVDSVLSVTPDSVGLQSGASRTLAATTVRSNGTAGPATGVTWTSRNPAVASVNGSGQVTGAMVGMTWVVGSSSWGSDSTRVTVAPGAPFMVTVSPDSVEVPAGAEETLTATVKDAAGNTVNTVLNWSSADGTVATVNQQGVVRGVEVGVTTVTAAAPNGASATADVVVASGEPVDFGFVPEPVSVRAGQTAGFTVNPLDDRGRVTILPDTLTLMTMIRDTSIAKIAGDGVVSGHATGSTWLVATAGSVVDSVMVNTVPGIAATTQFVSPSTDTTVTAGDTIQVTMQGTDVLGNVFTQTGFVLTSSNGSAVVPLGNLQFQGQQADTATLTATVDTVAKSISVTVQVGPAATLTITNPSQDTTLTSGDAVNLAATVTDAFGNVRGDAVTYASDAGGVVGVAGSTATAALVGTATITGSVGAISDQVDISVVHGPATSIAFTSPGADSVAIGQLDSLFTTFQATDAAGNDFTDGIAIASTDTDVATVDGSGLVFGAGLGLAEIITSRDGVADTLKVEVKIGALSVLTVAPASASASAINETVVFTGTATDKAANPVPDPINWTWTSSDPSVADVTAGGATASATFSAFGNGTVQIIGSAEKDGVTRADTASLTVQVVADTVRFSAPDSDTLNSVGETVDLSGRVTAVDANGNTINNPVVSWTGLDNGVATVDGSGVVTAVANGDARIVAQVDGAADTTVVTVEILADSIVISPVADTTAVGGTVQYSVEAFDAGGTPVAAAINWSSTDNGVATVDGNGLATGQGAGAARIIAASGNAADTAQIGVAGPNSLISTAFANGQDLLQVSPGETITVDITLDMGRVSPTGELGSVNLDFSYDTNVFEDVADSDVVSPLDGTKVPNANTDGLVSFGFINTNPQGESDLVVVTITLTVKAAPTSGRSAFTLSYDEAPASSNVVDGSYEFPVIVAGEVEVP